MTEKTITKTKKISGNFDWQIPEVISAFTEGKDALAIYNTVKELNLGGLDYDAETQTLRGSNPFIAARIDTQLQPLGIRVANLRDLGRQEIMGMIKDRYYTDIPAFVLRSMDDSYSKNLSLIKRIADKVENKNGKLQLPVLVSGFDVKPWPEDEKGYKIDIVARDDFSAIYDERLNGKYNGETFSEVDGLGLPKFDKNGNRTWCVRDKGLSGLYLDRDLDLGSSDEDLAYSNANGRVVVVSGGATSQKILGKHRTI